MRILKPSRKKPVVGDVFAIQLPDEKFLFGRLVSTEAQWALGEGVKPALLIYIYRVRSATKVLPERSVLGPENLLVSPIMTNRLPWSRGYFETIGNLPPEPGELLEQHCFLSSVRGEYFDDKGNELPGAVEPVGDWGLHSFRTIDDQISDALGFARVPD
jgi:hypothetical protein